MAQVGSPRQRRRRGRVKWLSHYTSAQTILVVGDGDLSFSLALAAAFGSGDSLVATTLDSYEALTRKYGQAKSNVAKLKRLGATVLHCVDAETMKHHHCLKMRQFDRIVFNFPHAGFIGQESDDHMIKAHQLLVRSFFHNAKHLLFLDGEIHVSHKKGQPYDRWKIEELASEFSLVMFDTVAFQKEHYPGYNQKRGDGDRCNEKFSLHNGHTFKFRVEREEVEECAQKGYPTHNLAIQSSQASPSNVVKQVWHAKSPRAQILESNKQEEKNASADTIKIGTKELEIKEFGKGPIVIGNPANPNGGTGVVHQAPMANDHKTRMSKVKPRDPKYTQAKWCPAGLPKTKKMRSQRMRNQDKVEQEAEKQMDEFFNEIQPVVPSKQVWRPRQIENAAASTSITGTPISSKENNTATITSPMPHNVLDFGPKNAIFEKPKRPVKHSKQYWPRKCMGLKEVVSLSQLRNYGYQSMESTCSGSMISLATQIKNFSCVPNNSREVVNLTSFASCSKI